MNTKKIGGTMLLFAFLITTGFALTAGCCNPGPDKVETVQAPNGERLQYAFSACTPPSELKKNIETLNQVFIIQGDVTAGNAQFIERDYHGQLFLTPRTTAGFVVQEKYEAKLRLVSNQHIEDVYTGWLEISGGSSAKNIPSPEAIEKKYGTKNSFPISADFTGKLYIFAIDIYTLGVKKNTEKKTLGAPSTLLYTDQITRFVSAFGSSLATELTSNGVQFLDTTQLLAVGATNMFFKESAVAIESVWEWDYLFDSSFAEFSGKLDPAAIRALMQAAEAVNDPRLLVIERAAATDNLKITAFGAEAFNAAMPADGYEFIWDFTGSNLQKIITDDLLRAIQVEYTEESLR